MIKLCVQRAFRPGVSPFTPRVSPFCPRVCLLGTRGRPETSETLSSPERTRDFIYSLQPPERSRLLQELRSFEALVLAQVLLHNAIPFVGFGFLDNAIMIAAGTQIEMSIGVTLGISTMAAAAMGNLVSDLAGLGLAGYVEILASRLGMQAPDLSAKQVDMWQTRLSSHLLNQYSVQVKPVDWPEFLSDNTSGSLRVEPENSIIHSNALVLVRLWEYDDSNDTADPQEVPVSSFLSPYQLQSFHWDPLVNLTVDPQTPTVRLCGRDDSLAFSNASFCLQLSAFGSGGREAGRPGLLHNANSSQLVVQLQGLLPRANRSRFLLELNGLGRPYGLSRLEVQRSIDDEYTPSIFTVSQWVSSSLLAFVQWKPVAYRRPDPTFSDGTPCHHSALVNVSGGSSSGLSLAFYGAEAAASFGLNISFGLAGEPFYNATRYLSWSVLVGMGAPPVDSFSPLVVSIMAVGLGSPLLLLLLGGVLVCVRRRSLADRQAYRPIN
ncbi:hypothetical protein NHX12_024211 [Muraenolepis orangiensis]|uniref:Uncharacterized protein n=1 Tax=Muraenolepis orangiensis TaxID=630683 RepID=A0A9Q0ITE8_9TELE|nr:hypothetical protein NHX12_024211 [Muraenolepis orangiensis]